MGLHVSNEKNAKAPWREGAKEPQRHATTRRGCGRPWGGRNRWAWKSSRTRAFETTSRPSGLRFESAGLAVSLFFKKVGARILFLITETSSGQNRRACGAAAGAKADWDGCSHPDQDDFEPAAGDPIACRSALMPSNASRDQHRLLCAFAPLRSFRSRHAGPQIRLGVFVSSWL